MRQFLIRFGKPLFIITTIIVLVFQGYWVINSFQNKRKEFLEQTKFEMTQILFNNLVRNSDGDKEKLDSIFGEGKIRFDLYPNLNSQNFVAQTIKNGTKTNKTKKKTNTKLLKIEIKKDTLYKTSSFDANSKVMDSILYKDIKTSIPELSNEKVVIYHENTTSKRTYPLNLPIKEKNTTGKVTPSNDENTYRIHIDNLSRIIIMNKMLGVILFSILYIILFIGTFYILYSTLLLNQKVLKNKEIFTRNMTHELKIPISTLLIAAEGLEKYNIINEPERARKYAKSIQRASHQLSSLVEAILQNARADNSTEKLSLISINLLTLLEEVKEILSDIITEKKAKIIIQDIDDSIHIKGNQEQMRQILLNLLDNSLKYSEQDPVIIISAKQNKNRILIKIEDNGIGIPEKYFQEIFKPYFRIPNGDLHDVKGFGLGLSFVKNSLKKQNGNIHIVKPESEGTVMELNMPLYES